MVRTTNDGLSVSEGIIGIEKVIHAISEIYVVVTGSSESVWSARALGLRRPVRYNDDA
jgi:hypothetical protein